MCCMHAPPTTHTHCRLSTGRASLANDCKQHFNQVEALKKKNAKKSGGASKKDKKEKEEPTSAANDEPEAETPAEEAAAADDANEKKPPIPPVPAAVQGLKIEDKAATGGDDGVPDVTSPSVQSKMRSASFKAGGPLSPGFPFTTPDGEGTSAADIYRKQVARIEDLEKENKRLAKEAADAEKRWQKAEGELDDLRENGGDEKKAGAGADGEIEKLVRVPTGFPPSVKQGCSVLAYTNTDRHAASGNRLTRAPEQPAAVGRISPSWLFTIRFSIISTRR